MYKQTIIIKVIKKSEIKRNYCNQAVINETKFEIM